MSRQTNEVKTYLDHRRGLKRSWWFTSFIFPLICAAFAPLANLFSVLSFVEPWVVVRFRTFGPTNPTWLSALNGTALGTAVVANIILLLSFARRLRHIIAQPLTIVLWYISSTLHIVALCMTKTSGRDVFSQSYYYALLSCVMHLCMATLLLLSLLPSFNLPFLGETFPAYPTRMLTLTAPQRTLMIQTLFFTLYLALGAGIFAALNGWAYLDAIFWTNYSLLTIGFGSDLTLISPVAKGLLIPYAAIGIFMLGLVVGSIRTLFVQRFQERVIWGREIVQKERKKWWRTKSKKGRRSSRLWRIFMCWRKRDKNEIEQEEKCVPPMRWSKEEWDLMRMLKDRVDMRRRYLSLLTTSTLFFVIWFGGGIIFIFTERGQGFTYGISLYFTYVSLLTIGYGDVIPKSNAGKPVFVLWSLAAIPAVTLLISDLQDTLARWVKEGPIENIFGRWLVGSVEEEEPCAGGSENEEQATQEDCEKSDSGHIEKELDGATTEGTPYKEVAGKARVVLYEVRKLLGDEENTRYSWEEWQKWLKILELDEGGRFEEGDVSNWSFLGDDGPLLSIRESEKIWILSRFRQNLDELFGRLPR